MLIGINGLSTKSKNLLGAVGASLGLMLSSISHAFTIEDVDFDSTFGLQTRTYDSAPSSPIQRRHEFLSFYFQQEISYQWNGGRNNFVFTPYVSGTRYQDPLRTTQDGFVPFIIPIPIIEFIKPRTAHRSYGDIRELLYTHIADSNAWGIRAGIGKVFWGVSESQHLVDVINQDDLRSDIDGEDKLGQPMINLTLSKNYGNFDFFALPGFRERVYQVNEGRLNPVFFSNPYEPVSQSNFAIMINDGKATFESGAEEFHTDFAFRWSHSIGASDIGLSYFQGTNRDPLLAGQIINEELYLSSPANASPAITASGSAEFTDLEFVTPHYEQMTQVGIDYQATLGGWLLKFEGIYRDSDSLKTPIQDQIDAGNIALKTTNYTTDYTAFTAGFEYTLTGIFNSPSDLGFIVEYLSDSRDFEATTPFQDDVFLGLRYAQNNAKDRTLLIGVTQDLELDSYFAIAELSRRIGQYSKIGVEMIMAYADGQAQNELGAGFFDPTVAFNNEDHMRLTWETFF